MIIMKNNFLYINLGDNADKHVCNGDLLKLLE